MKHITALLFASILGLGFMPSMSFAASQNECAIWLCLPSGFPSGCGGAKSAFKNRIKHHKPPLPPFASCSVKKTNLTYTQGKAYYEPAETCTGWYSQIGGNCQPHPARWVKNGSCNMMGCQSKNYIDIFDSGKPLGGTYFW
jgi:hypothetical protein